jgi:hypothetical protein
MKFGWLGHLRRQFTVTCYSMQFILVVFRRDFLIMIVLSKKVVISPRP